jgi:mono/diheme cytochrome c family protein
MTLTLAACAHHTPPPAATDTLDDSAPTPSVASVSRGHALYAQKCSACHGVEGAAGPVGPALHGERMHKDRDAVIGVIERPLPPMPKLFPGELSAQDVADLAAYVESM